MPPLIITRQNDRVVAMAAKIVDEIILSILDHLVPDIVTRIDARFSFGKVVHSPCQDALLRSKYRAMRGIFNRN